MACALVEGVEKAWRPQPGVINTHLIRQAVSQMLRDDVTANNIAEDEGYELAELRHLYLEHLDILRVDHLWVMPGLTVLKLTGNLIEKIENLDTLVELVDLNLSFNKISVIENLNKLTKLRHLSLFSNQISELQNIDHLKELKIFSIGENKICDTKCILHLRQLELFSLNMAGNPCAKENGFRFTVAAYLPTLEYYEYTKVSDDERVAGRNVHLQELETLEREEATVANEAEEAKAAVAKDQLHRRAFVQGLDGGQLCEAIMEADPAGAALLLIGGDVVDAYQRFREEIGKAAKEIFSLGLEQLDIRNKEIEMFKEAVKDAIEKNREKQRRIIEVFLDTKYDNLGEINELYASKPTSDEAFRKSIEQEVDKTNNLCQSVKRELMTLELSLSEQLKEVYAQFERSLGDMVNSFIEAAQGFFTTMREHESVFSEQLGDQAARFLTQLTIRNEDVTSLPPPLRPIMVDKEAVNQAVAGSHDAHLQVIDNREDELISRARASHDYEQEETARFRGRVGEIVAFMELQARDLQQYSNMDDADLDGHTEHTL